MAILVSTGEFRVRYTVASSSLMLTLVYRWYSVLYVCSVVKLFTRASWLYLYGNILVVRIDVDSRGLKLAQKIQHMHKYIIRQIMDRSDI